VDPDLVAPLDPQSVAKRICRYFDLSPSDRRALGDRCREVCSNYTEERAVSLFVRTLRQMLSHFNLPDLAPEIVARYGEAHR
jgi:hypothetical protein